MVERLRFSDLITELLNMPGMTIDNRGFQVSDEVSQFIQSVKRKCELVVEVDDNFVVYLVRYYLGPLEIIVIAVSGISISQNEELIVLKLEIWPHFVDGISI